MFRLFLFGALLTLACGDDVSSTTPPGGDDPSRMIDNEPPEADMSVPVVDTADEGMPEAECREGERRACNDACGVSLCVNGQFQESCETASELCNGIDDDCDDAIDEDYEPNGLGFSCQAVLENGCTASGINVCSESGTSVVCETEPVEPVSEVCDGLDNDCDGSTDEDFPDSLCCLETYQCPLGNVCTDGLCTKDESSINPGNGSGSSSCETSNDCPFGQYCESGSCVSAGGICISDDDCAAGYRCDDFICIPGSSGTACTYDFECESGEVCEDGRCESDDDFCFVDADCPNGFECQTLVCVPTDTTTPGQTTNFCSDIVALNDQSSVEGTTLGRADSYRPSCAFGNSEAPDLIYRWRPTQSGEYTIDTNGSGFDTILAIVDDCDMTGTELACNDDGGEGTRSSITLNVNAFQTYFIVVSGYFSTAEGATVVNITSTSIMEPECRVNSDCDANFQCNAGQCEPQGNDGFCASATTVFTNVELSSSTLDADDVIRPSCGQSSSSSPDGVHRWTPTRAGSYTLTTNGSDFDTVLAIYDGCDEAATSLDCDDDGGDGSQSSLTLTVEAFTTYYVVVSGYKTDARGNYVLNIAEDNDVTPECTTSNQCAANERCEANRCVLAPAETSPLCDHFRDASLIDSDYPVELTGTLSTNVVENCEDNDGPDYDIRWYPIQSGTYTIRAESEQSTPLILGIYEGCNSYSGRRVSCINDWFSLNYESTELTVDVDAIDEYEIVVSGQDSDDNGRFTVTITQDQ